MWELPGGDLDRGEKPADGAGRLLEAGLGLHIEAVRSAGRVQHEFTHRRLTLHLLRAEAVPGRVRRHGFSQHRWLSPGGLHKLPSATLTRKALEALEP